MSNGQEFYPSQPGEKPQYAKDHNNNEFYVTHNGKQMYAKDENGQQFYAKLADQSEHYAKDENNNDYYVKTKNGEVYAKNKNQEEIYGTNADGTQTYAKNKRGRPKFIKVGNKEVYAKDALGNERYPRNAQGKCIVAKNDNIPYYITVDYELVYPTDENNNQYVVNNNYITGSDGKIVFPLDNWGEPIYEKDENGDEKYKYNNLGYPIFGKDKNGEEIYAKLNNYDEYYPTFEGKVVFAKGENAIDKYALGYWHIIIYPTENGEKFYIKGSNKLLQKYYFNYIPGKYPKDDSNKDILISNKYAPNEFGNLFYPKDEYENEYVKNPDSSYQHTFINNEYPVTNDGYIIIPNYLNEPFYCKANKDITEKNIVKLLYRSNAPYDFLTNVKTQKKSQNLIPYKTLSLGPPQIPIYLNKIFQYVVGILIFIIIILLVN